jgi:hypothetical protein
VTSIQRQFLVDECLPPKLISNYLHPHVAVTEHPVTFVHFKQKFGPYSKWVDPDFVPELARDQRWVVLSSDLEKGSHLDALRLVCRQYKVTLILTSAKLKDASLEVYGPHFQTQWPNIMDAANGPRGGQYLIRFANREKNRTEFQPLECPPGYKTNGVLCVPEDGRVAHNGEPVPLNKHGRPKRRPASR